jgi:two-component system nitrogen regulation sensor histidine kinase NtrY
VTVQDDGAGIPPGIYPKLFTPFVTSKAKGTGLGLSLAKKFVEAHGGTITLASLPQGTRAEIRLPGAPPAGGV